MSITIESLPNDPVALKALLVDQQRKINGLQAQVDTLFESLRLERYRKYGKKSEKDPASRRYFREKSSGGIGHRLQSGIGTPHVAPRKPRQNLICF